MNFGLKSTHFETPHGLDNDNHYTTAYELALLSNYAMKNKTFATIVNTIEYTVTINGYPKAIRNTNELLGNVNGVYGIKTGFTNGANRCLVSCCKRNDLDIICVVLGADTKNFRTRDSIKLIEYTFKNYEPVNLKEIMKKEFTTWKEKNSTSFTIIKGTTNIINLEMINPIYSIIPIHKQDIEKISVQIDCTTNLTAPISINSKIGTITCKINEKILIETNIKVTETINKKNIFNYLAELIKNYKYIKLKF